MRSQQLLSLLSSVYVCGMCQLLSLNTICCRCVTQASLSQRMCSCSSCSTTQSLLVSAAAVAAPIPATCAVQELLRQGQRWQRLGGSRSRCRQSIPSTTTTAAAAAAARLSIGQRWWWRPLPAPQETPAAAAAAGSEPAAPGWAQQWHSSSSSRTWPQQEPQHVSRLVTAPSWQRQAAARLP